MCFNFHFLFREKKKITGHMLYITWFHKSKPKLWRPLKKIITHCQKFCASQILSLLLYRKMYRYRIMVNWLFVCDQWKHDTLVFFKNIINTGALILFTYMHLLVSKMFFLYTPSSINSFTCTVTDLFGCATASNLKLRYIFVFGFLLIKFQFDKKS